MGRCDMEVYCRGIRVMMSTSVALPHFDTLAVAHRKLSVIDLIRERWGWLLIFFGGLVLAALVVEAFEDVLKHNVELSYFVPLLIGHGGNTGSQSNATVIR